MSDLEFEREVTLLLRGMGVCPWCQSSKSKYKTIHDAKCRVCLDCGETFYIDNRQDGLEGR